MVTAIVLLKVERTHVNDVAQQLTDMEGISEVYSVGGRWDLVVMVRVHTNEDLADVVTGHMLKLEGILQTETLIAFRAYSRHDLENMFSLGL
ncbi:MAG: Lrp/AsnC ligand binding domain-containing protein [Thiohalobacteraceae bacterium]